MLPPPPSTLPALQLIRRPWQEASGSDVYSQSKRGLPTILPTAPGMRSSGERASAPASSSSTLAAASSARRAATTQPALPPPITT